MNCPNCNATLPTGARFCSQCGKPVASPSPPRKPMKLAQIVDIYKRGDCQQSRTLLQDYLQSDPKNADAWIILGNALRELDEDDEAEKAYMKALELNPLAYEAHTGLGVVNRKRGFYDLAINFYELALKANPRYAQAYSSMAHVELKRGRDAEALQYALKGYELDKKDPVVAGNLAVVYHYNNRFAERDRMFQVCQKMGYRNLDGLQRIFRGETTVRDEGLRWTNWRFVQPCHPPARSESCGRKPAAKVGSALPLTAKTNTKTPRHKDTKMQDIRTKTQRNRAFVSLFLWWSL